MLQRLGAGAELSLTGESAARLAEEISQGRLAHLPLMLGQSVQTLTDEYGLLLDPDEYEGGRMIQLEGAAFRQVYLLTDALTDTWSHSTLQGIRLDRANLHGLCTGFTTIAAWREALGEPDSTVTVDASQAESWRTVPGQSDYYVFGDVRLRLHADEDGVLHSIWLMQ